MKNKKKGREALTMASATPSHSSRTAIHFSVSFSASLFLSLAFSNVFSHSTLCNISIFLYFRCSRYLANRVTKWCVANSGCYSTIDHRHEYFSVIVHDTQFFVLFTSTSNHRSLRYVASSYIRELQSDLDHVSRKNILLFFHRGKIPSLK